MSLEGQMASHYRFERLLGSGSMGEVYLATDTHLQRQVAIKVIRLEGRTPTRQEATRLFQREMKAIAALDHPHVLPLFDYGELTLSEEMNLTYMVIPYRPEGSLAAWLGRRQPSGPLSLQVTAALLSQAANALSHAHAHGIIHLDVKLANFLVQIHEDTLDSPHLLLADFGVAKMSMASFTASHAVRGTPLAMPPEQWAGQPTPASDQYALAVMAYELLTGRPPFRGNLNQLMYQHSSSAPLPPSQLTPSLPLDIDAVLLKALAKKADQRFASISAFSQAFKEASEQDSEARRETLTSAKSPQSLSAQISDALAPTLATSSHLAQPAPKPMLTSPLPLPPSIPASPSSPLFQTQSRRHPLIRLLLGVLVLLMITGAIGGAWLFESQQAFSLRSGAIARAEASVTSFAQMQAHSPYPTYLPGNGTLALTDSLAQASPLHWERSPGCSYRNSALLVTTLDPHYATSCSASGVSFEHLAYEVTMTILVGDKGGCLFDLQEGEGGSTDYDVFMVSRTGYYEVYRYHSGNPGSFSPLLLPTFSSAIHQGLHQSNLLTVLAIGNALHLYVNQQEVATTSASIPAAGTIGVFASSFGGAEDVTEVTYQNVRVWTL